MKWLAILFTIFIILIIVLADAGILRHYVGFIWEFPFGDKVGHFILYGIMTLLIDLSLFHLYPDQSPGRLAVKCGLILAVLIGLEEFSQRYFSSRTSNIVDLTFSYLGVAFFSWLAVNIKNRRAG